MDIMQKLETLGTGAQYDLCGACMNSSGPAAHRQRGNIGRWIYPSALPDGRSILLLKVLMYNICENNCLYCIHSSGNDRPLISFMPEELAALFMKMLRSGLAHGLFLSSTIYRSAERTMDDMLKVAELLRYRYRFNGYIHLKALPGATSSQLEHAVKLAQRISVNLEVPSAARLLKVAPGKNFQKELLGSIGMLHRLIRNVNHGRHSFQRGQTTQFMVGASGESDTEILGITRHLYDRFNLSRIYFSAFQPIKGTPLEGRKPSPLLREHRLYQTDFLFRRYGFSMDDIGFTRDGNLPLNKDPKTIWAEAHPEFFPVEINSAPKEILLRVPGFGPATVKRLLHIRKTSRFRTLDELKRLGALTKRSAVYILINGRKHLQTQGSQLELWKNEPVHFGKTALYMERRLQP